MKLWKKIAIGFGIITVYSASVGNTQQVSSPLPTIPPAGIYQNQNTNDVVASQQPTVESVTNSDTGTYGFKSQSYSPKPVTEQTPAQNITPIDTYVNSSGNVVQSPTYYDSQPAGATARCRDGTYSFSQHRSGTCSHHGGVAEWL